MGNCVSSQKGDRNKLRKVVVEEGNNVENGKQPLDSAENSVTEKISFGSNSSESISNEEKAPDYFNRARIFPFRELAAVTKNFRDESCIGKGGFGTVYKGNLESTGQAVAVKKLDTKGLQGDEEFLVEILMLSLLRHPNLVTMIGYCAEGDQRLLVYEYVQLGSLETHLHDLPPDQQPLDWNTRMIIYIKKYGCADLPPDQQPLDWNTRMMIAYGTAKGLHYLHNEADPPVIYRDLKSANILLDEGFHPKLSDFGLAKFGPSKDQTHVSTRVMGTQGYCDPEYVSSGMLTMKSDVYSFGVVLLELITGRRALDDNHGRDRQLVAWARPMLRDRRQYLKMVDPRLQGQWSASTMKMAIQLASMCIRHDSIFRPVVAEILQALDCLVSRQNFPIKLRNIANSSSQEDEDSLKETTRILMKQQREQAVAEAKQWEETWRERRRSSLSRHEEFKYMAVDSQ